LINNSYGAVASKRIFNSLSSDESGDAVLLTDNELMQAVALADARAFSLLMGRHVPSMTALARRITLNGSDADDIVQEAFLRVWVHAPRWRSEGLAQFRTWLQRIVTNLAIDRCRKPKNLPLETAGDPADPSLDAEAKMQINDEIRQVRAALLKLPPQQRAAIALYYYDDLTAAQVAEVLDRRTGAIEVLLTRARRALRSLLTSEGVADKEGRSK